VLIQKPRPGDFLYDVCNHDQDLQRDCRYQIKDFAEGYLNAIKYSSNSKNLFEVYFPVNRNIFLYGRKSKTQGDITQKNSDIREIGLWKELKGGELDEMQAEDENFYLTIPFFKFLTPEQALKTAQEKGPEAGIKAAHEKQTMVYFGKLLHDMYKGLEYKRDNGFNPVEGGFNPGVLKFSNYTDIFLALHKNDKTQKVRKFWADDYFGFKKSFVEKVTKFIAGEFPNQGEQKEMDNELEKSFAGFVSKLANYDDEGKNQFEGYDAAIKHEFITGKVGSKKTRSDTSYDI